MFRKGDFIWNVAGVASPMLVGLIAVPVLIKNIGVERLGLLSMAWVLVGYLGVLDLGLGRALTRFVSRPLEGGVSTKMREQLINLTTFFLCALGVLWSVFFILFSEYYVNSFFNLAETAASDVGIGFKILGLAAPFMLFSTARMAILEGNHNFTLANKIKIPLGVLTFLFPVLVSFYSRSIIVLFSSLLIVRICFSCVLAFFVPLKFLDFEVKLKDYCNEFLVMLKFGAWLSISNIIGPVLSYFDRFYIGSVISVAAVTYYTVPSDVLVRMTALPVSVMAVFFPLFSAAIARKDSTENVGIGFVGIVFSKIWLPCCFLALALGEDFLRVWVGVEMTVNVLPLWKIIVVGVFANGMAHLPLTILQSAGRSDISAKIHLFELLPYLVFLYLLTAKFGLNGVAFAWITRAILDSIFLSVAAMKCVELFKDCLRLQIILIFFGVLLLSFMALFDVEWARYVFGSIAAIFLIAGLRQLLVYKK